MTYDEILKACVERAPDDTVLQAAFDELIYQHVGIDKRASAINNAGAERQVEVLKKKGYATERILVEIADQFAISVHALGERVTSPAVPVPPKKKKTKPAPVLKRVRFVYEVLCPVDDAAVEKMGLADIQMACEQGDCSGHFVDTSVKLLNYRQAELACEEHGTDIVFFNLPQFPVGTRVWWSDPDQGLCSGWGTVADFHGDIYDLKMEGSGDTEANSNELSLKKPRKA